MPKIVDVEEKRTLIAEAACRVVVARGVANTRMVDIAAEADVTTGMLVNYFDTKDDIILAALRLAFRNIEAKIAERAEDRVTTDLCDILEPAIPATEDDRADIAVWINFWGMLSADPELQKLNRKLHAEGMETYERAIRSAWPECADWSDDVFSTVRFSIVSCLFGLSAAGIVNPSIWPKKLLRNQLRLHLDLIWNLWGGALETNVCKHAQLGGAEVELIVSL